MKKMRVGKEMLAQGSVKASSYPRAVLGVLVLTVVSWFVSVFSPNSSTLFALKKSVSTDSGTDAGAVSTATREGRLAVFDDLWQTVADRYYTGTFHGVDWLAQRSQRGMTSSGAPLTLSRVPP